MSRCMHFIFLSKEKGKTLWWACPTCEEKRGEGKGKGKMDHRPSNENLGIQLLATHQLPGNQMVWYLLDVYTQPSLYSVFFVHCISMIYHINHKNFCVLLGTHTFWSIIASFHLRFLWSFLVRGVLYQGRKSHIFHISLKAFFVEYNGDPKTGRVRFSNCRK